MTNKSTSIINRKRLDQKVSDLTEVVATLTADAEWQLSQDRYDFERLVEIIAGLARAGTLQQKLVIARIHRDRYASELAANSITVELQSMPPPPPWWRRLFRKGKS